MTQLLRILVALTDNPSSVTSNSQSFITTLASRDPMSLSFLGTIFM